MTNKYKNNSEDMHLVAESLNEFQLFENMEEAKKVFSNMGFDENSEEWKDFKKAFEVEPDLADKFAKWLEPEVDNEDFLSDFRSVIDSFERAQEENVSYDELNSFTSLTQYLRGIDRIIYRRKLQKAEKESEKTLSKKEEELQELQNLVENPEILIDKLNLHKVGNALYCSESVWLTGDIQKRGQGVYIWTDLILLRNWDGKSKNLKTKFKFGQYGSNVIKSAEREEDIPIQGKDLGLVGKKAYETIESYSGTSIGTKVIIYVNDLTDFLKDDPRFEKAIEIENLVRTKIIDSDKKPWALYTPAKSKEVYFGGTLGDLEIEINEVITGVAKQESFKMKDEQKNAYNKIISALVDNNKDEFLLAAKMRFGKNFTVLNVIKQLNELYPDSNFKNTLVTTYKPAVFVSLEKDIENHTSFDGWEIIDLRNNSNLPGDKNKIRIFVASAQWALHKGSNKELESLDYDEETRQELEKRTLETLSKNIQKLKSINFGLIVADEYHYGTKSNNFNKLLEELNYEKIIWVSGTAMKDLATGRFEDDQIYQWSYIEEQKKREKELKEREKNPNGYYPNINMPKMHFYKMNLSKKAQDLAHDRGLYSADQGFSFKKLIEVDKDKRLVNEPLMRTLLEQIVGTDYGHLNSVMKAQGVRGNLDHTFWVFARSILGIEATADLMRSMPEFKNYEIIEATGGKNTSIQKVKRKIKESAANGKKSITLSCYRFKEGTTVPWWNGVIMLDGGHSAEEYLQAIFRCQSPNPKDKKEDCYVFDFNPERLLSIYHDIAQWGNKEGKESESKMLKELLTYAPILQSNGNEMVEVDAQEVIENFRIHGSFSEKMANDRVFNKEAFDEIENYDDMLEDLSNVSSKRNATVIKVNTHGLDKSKDANRRRQETSSDNSREELEDIENKNLEILREKCRNVLRALPSFLMTSKNDEKTIYQIIDTPERDLFEETCGVKPEFLQKLIDKKMIYPKIINQTIEYLGEAIKYINHNPSIENINEFIKNNLIIRAEEGSTPPEIVNEMLDKLPSNIWSDSRKKFCDPCCGTGMFLLGIYERLNAGLMDKFPDEKQRKKHIIENMLWGVDISSYKTAITKNFLGANSYKNNIIKKDSLTLNWNDMPKFDVVVGNPPYKGSLHLKFLNIAYNISKQYIVWIHPSVWLLDEKGNSERYYNAKELIKDTIKEFTFINGNPIFKVGFFSPFVIDFIDKNNKNPEIKIIDKINNKELTVDNIHDINKWSDYEIYPILKGKIMNLNKKDNLFNHQNKKEGNFYVNVAALRGHVEGESINVMKADDFYSILTKNDKPENNPTKRIYFSFKSKKEADNFIKFLKTRWAMFSFSIYKTDQNIASGRILRSVPWLNWNIDWTEEKFEHLIKATSEEIAFVNKNIPDYYNK